MNVDTHGLSGAYAVDALTDEERAAFEAHMSTCAECPEETQGLRAAATELTYLTEVAPPAALKSAVMRDIKAVRPLPPVQDMPPAQDEPEAQPRPVTSIADAGRHRRRNPVSWLLAAAAAAILAIGGLTAWHPWDRGTSQTQVSATQQVLHAKDAQRVAKTLPQGATATVVRSKSLGKAVIITDNLPPAPAGKAYELWFQTPRGTMDPAGLMPRDSQPSQPVLLKGDAASAIAVGITIEPATGSDSPTTPPIAVLKLA